MDRQHHNFVSPIIVLGMHRSGTSLISGILDTLGIFMGKHIGRHHEADFFVKINTWLYKQAGADWDAPNPFQTLLKHNDLRKQLILYLQFLLNSFLTSYYLGLARYVTCRNMFHMNCRWGWKDPANCHTLPIWLKIFPDAKIIYIKRHGIDVASSLKTRGEQYFMKNEIRFEKSALFRWYLVWRQHFTLQSRVRAFSDSVVCRDLNKGIRLWDNYNNAVLAVIGDFPEKNLLSLKYEDLLCNPVRYIEKLKLFCGSDIPTASIQKIASTVDQSKAYAYKKDQELIAIAEENREILSHHQY